MESNSCFFVVYDPSLLPYRVRGRKTVRDLNPRFSLVVTCQITTLQQGVAQSTVYPAAFAGAKRGESNPRPLAGSNPGALWIFLTHTLP